MVTEGMKASKLGKNGLAAQKFHTYLKILEDWKEVGDNGLSPKQFDPKLELPELGMIVGVYWELVRIYDKARSSKDNKIKMKSDLNRYLDKYILFSKGSKFEKACAELLRKYIQLNKPQNKDAFKAAYEKMTGGKKCFVATALNSEIDMTDLMRFYRIRDEYLLKNRGGRIFVRFYYVIGPTAACLISFLPGKFRILISRILLKIADLVEGATGVSSQSVTDEMKTLGLLDTLVQEDNSLAK